MKRRRFLHQFSATGALLSTGALPLDVFAKPELQHLTILHTNDVHSRIEPFPMDGSRLQGMGGAARRAALIDAVRVETPNVLLFDSGDIFQGTPYFNMFGGEVEIRVMSEMQYDATTIGNHDFDGGMDGLLKQMPLATFPFVICNYDFSSTILHGHTIPYSTFMRDNIRIGVLGVGIELNGLVPDSMYGETQYLDPVVSANKTAAILRHDEKCDFVICLSHLGHKYQDDKVSDTVLAKSSSDIDLILGGHTHTFLERPELHENAVGRPVLINQVGWAGVRLGRIDMTFERNCKHRCVSCNNLWVK
ncbi:MAG TPA: metallophosphatase [Saprospiraceae bacterium]|nr:metallophosphatase [Saprospiraceae bacterium]